MSERDFFRADRYAGNSPRTGIVIVMERPDGVHFYREIRGKERPEAVIRWLLECFDYPTTWTWSVKRRGSRAS